MLYTSIFYNNKIINNKIETTSQTSRLTYQARKSFNFQKKIDKNKIIVKMTKKVAPHFIFILSLKLSRRCLAKKEIMSFKKNKNKFLVYFFISSALAVHLSESSKVIFARNSTAAAIRKAEKERLARELESSPVMGTILNIPSGCKPGFVFESTFHHRCRRIVG